MKRVLVGILVLFTMSTMGCGLFRRNYLVPELLPKEDMIAAELEAKYLSYDDTVEGGNTPKSEIKRYINDLKTATDAAGNNNLSEQQKLSFQQRRNNILSNLTLLMDIRYRQYERSFYNVDATAGSAFDIAVLGMTAAGAVSGGAETKAILSAIAAGLTGTRLALEKNFLYEQTSPIIIKQMQKLRKAKLADIDKKMAEDIYKYPLERGLIDIAEYFYSGTIVSALQDMSDKLAQKTVEQEIEHFDALTEKFAEAMKTKAEREKAAKEAEEKKKREEDARRNQPGDPSSGAERR